MDRRTFLSAGTIALWSQLSGARAEKEANAAEHYQKAFLLLPELTEEENQLLDSLPAAPFNEVGSRLIERCERALGAMTRAAALEKCDWRHDFAKGIDDRFMTPLMKTRQLAKLTCLRAGYSLQHKAEIAPIDDLTATVRMGRHVGKNGPFMATLVQLAIENSVIHVVAAYLPQQNAKTAKALGAFLNGLPKDNALNGGLKGEKHYILQFFPTQLRNKNSDEAFDLLRRSGYSDEEIRVIRKIIGSDVEKLLKLIDGAAQLCDDVAKISALPRSEFMAALSALKKNAQHNNPIAGSVIPSIEGVRYACDRTEVLFAMLQAAIAVSLQGTDELKRIKDPFGDGPFEYRSFGGGFELRSNLHEKDRGPAILTVGVETK
jgi:hypothetical protein